VLPHRGAWRALRTLSLGALLAAAFPVRADEPPPSPSDADTLFDEGRALLEQGNAKAAQEKFEASNRLEASAGTFLNLGQCLEAQGKTASALIAYKRAIELGKSTNKPRHVETAEKFIAALEPRLSKIVVHAPDAPPDLQVTAVDGSGARVALGAIDEAIPVDPDTYTVEATAPKHTTWSSTVDATASGEVSVTVPLLDATDSVKSGFRPDALFIGGAATAGAGLVLIAVGAGFGVATLNDASTASTDPKLCPKYRCTPAGQQFIDNTQNESLVSSVAITVGAAAAVAGGVMITWSLLHPPKASSTGAAAGPIVPVPIVVASPTTGTFVGVEIRGAL